jgi:quinone-modifying oxidoreductase subunit QmoA
LDTVDLDSKEINIHNFGIKQMEQHQHTEVKYSADILVVGAGIAGISTALEAAETGYSVILVEKNPNIGGRVVQLNEYFPKLCPPTCGMEINIKRLKSNSKINLITLARIDDIEGGKGNYTVKIKEKPRFVTNRCTVCHECVEVCPVEQPDDFNYGLSKTKAIYMPYNNAYPQRYVIDGDICLGEECNKCVKACQYTAIDLTMKTQTYFVKVKSIVWATGWDPYDANKLNKLGFGRYPNVITNMMMERLAAPNGPTNGEIVLPGINEIKKVAFVQCAGSRDENHLEYCSSVCCMASLKQAHYIRDQYEDTEIHIFYIDIRSPGFFEDFYRNVERDEKVFFHRGKVAKVFKNHDLDKLTVEAEDTLSGYLQQMDFDLVILATGMQATARETGSPVKKYLDENAFLNENDEIVGCGVCSAPQDVATTVQESTGAAMKAVLNLMEGN